MKDVWYHNTTSPTLRDTIRGWTGVAVRGNVWVPVHKFVRTPLRGPTGDKIAGPVSICVAQSVADIIFNAVVDFE